MMDKFKQILNQSKHVLILTGAGVSAESDIPTFRGSGGFWRKYQSQMLATPQAFKKSPSLVWEFYHYRRELVLTKSPNKVNIFIYNDEIYECLPCGIKYSIRNSNALLLYSPIVGSLGR